ncbi:hypothetical protein L873DRAFT_1796009 [Choiromyces venosus 120613-1]|uniref:Uncharacterized protein n=1 Tax=Choiromyces venosus 120613-1 TaxID=1336337 RepID=A0A3N4IX85_9PEZI|nr:hypothetical protein L873DRAFT_1796009 [Choiromyces venosus 120613-1]
MFFTLIGSLVLVEVKDEQGEVLSLRTATPTSRTRLVASPVVPAIYVVSTAYATTDRTAAARTTIADKDGTSVTAASTQGATFGPTPAVVDVLTHAHAAATPVASSALAPAATS